MQVYDAQGRVLRLGEQIGRGGEGSVYELPTRADAVAKIYHRPPDAEQIGKLRALVKQNDSGLQKIAAWPVELVAAQAGGQPTGYLMQNLKGFKQIHVLYGPKSRLTEFPAANYRFLIHTAMNLARAFAAVHAHGVIVGDVNHANAYISQHATVKIIDSDSFQIRDRDTGKTYICHVGVSTHQPPELQARGSFDGVVRTPNHDAFGLAVLIFQLLYMGRHPFSGTYLGAGDMPIERAIPEHRFVYGNMASSRQMKPPPGLPALHTFTAVAPLFERAFGPGADVGTGRPSAEDWLRGLEQLQNELQTCRQNPAHALPAGTHCPWCALELATGAMLFFVPSAVTQVVSGPFNLTLVWGQIVAVSSPGAAPTLPQPKSLGLAPSPEARQRGRTRRGRVLFTVVLVVVGLVAWGKGFPFGGAAAFWNFAAAAVIAFLLAKNTSNTKDSTYAANAAAAQAEWDAIVARWLDEAGDSAFRRKLSELERDRQDYLDIPNLQQRKLDQLVAGLEQRQRQRFLDAYEIAQADIPGIGQVRVATLLSYGIETAADVDSYKVLQVPGFGPALTDTLMRWRNSVERRFRFDPRLGVNPSDIAQVETEMAVKKTQLEQILRGGATELHRLAEQAKQRREILQTQVDRAIHRVAQAEADLTVS